MEATNVSLASHVRLLVVVAVAMLFAAIAGWTFIGLSFRSDWFGFWQHLKVGYTTMQSARQFFAYLTHRIAAVLWTMCIFIQLGMLFIWQRRYPRLHMFFGVLTVWFDFANIASGILTLYWKPFDDIWSTAFVSINAILNALLIVLFVLSRADFIVPRKAHPALGFCFAFSPIGFLLQINIFYGECWATRKNRIKMWHMALILAAVVAAAIGMLIYLTYEAWFSTRATIERKVKQLELANKASVVEQQQQQPKSPA